MCEVCGERFLFPRKCLINGNITSNAAINSIKRIAKILHIEYMSQMKKTINDVDMLNI